MALAGHPVKVSCVHPGGIKTAIARNATAAEGIDAGELAQAFDAKLASTTPERAAQIILEGVRKNRARVRVRNMSITFLKPTLQQIKELQAHTEG